MRSLGKLVGSLVFLGGVIVLVASDVMVGAVFAILGVLILVAAFAGRQKKCPFCAELVKAEAKTCKHCGKDLPA